MDIKDYFYEEFHNDKLKYGEKFIIDKLFLYKEVRKNINMIENGIPLLAKISYYLNNYDAKNANYIYHALNQTIGRTLSIRIPELNEVKDLSGPIRVIYYKNNKYNKKIICLGDHHQDFKYSCDEKVITIENYLDKLFKKTDNEIDFFIEMPLPNKEYLLKKNFYIDLPKDVNMENSEQSKWEGGYLLETRVFAENNYKRYINKRIHFTDLRENELVAFIYLVTIDWTKNPSFDEYKRITIKNHNFIISLYKYFQTTISPKYQTYDEFNIELDKSIPINIPNYLRKEIDKSPYDIKIKIRDHIIPIIYDYIHKYIYNYKISNFKVEFLSNEQIILNTIISDIYTIMRIMKNINKSTDFKNCILYYGDNHIYHINFLLTKIFDFQQISEKKSISYDAIHLNTNSKNTDMRCIRDIIPFDKFFSASY